MKLSRTTLTAAAAVALMAAGALVWNANAQQPGSDQPTTTQPGGPHRPGRGGPGGGGGGGDGGGDGAGGRHSKWAEDLKTEVAEHPRMGQALVRLHEAKDYMEKSKEDFGGHKTSTIKAIDDAIKELNEAIKFDPKHERKDDKSDPKSGKPGDSKPGDSKPGTDPKPTSGNP
jgi:hypothetical protein